ncbi:hypothetical protein [Flavobacterium saccharophilum]|uniref:TIR domain-containing protein n=1 Tax=Flavobacterium saccharophilum TaxID=29534 RepID=A0A1M7M045_9FLAO|nr:hypothetical protein [Flavobacterium saccharophilum]SHM84043.1 hypothetical protein SAMN05444366_4280 [Flavobacterium saccharophilum]
MYRGFNLKITEDLEQRYLISGYTVFKYLKDKAIESLDNFFLKNGSLDGNKIMESWFPNVPSHIFLSHSHKDIEKAILIAGMLYENFKIITFIDSIVWSYCNDLLKQIDDNYSLNDDKLHYSYERRNYTTAHVHLMLSTALNKMIDSSESVFFLNSPNSISTETEISQKTNSPWIFSEISTTQIIRKQTPERLKPQTKLFKALDLNESQRSSLTIEYDLELSHLRDINSNEFNIWIQNQTENAEEALDLLYNQFPLKPKFLI